MPEANKALGQHVKKPATDKLHAGKGFVLERVVRAVAVSHDKAAVPVMAFEPLLAECGLPYIAGQVAQRGTTTPGGLALSDQFFSHAAASIWAKIPA